MSEVTFHDHDSVSGALEAAGATKNPTSVHSALKRVYREAIGDPAEPAASDYLAAISATDGALCVKLNREQPIIFRGGEAVPDDASTDYQRYDEAVEDPVVVDVPSAVISNWVAQWGGSLRLYDDRVAGWFAKADPFDGGSDVDLNMQRARTRSYRGP
jgi:hypothetical protein